MVETGGMRLRQMGIGDILDETFRLYRRHFLSFVTAMAVVAVPVAVLSTVVNVALAGTAPSATPSPQFFVGLFAATVPIAIISGVGHVLNSGAVIRLASDAVLGQSLDIGAVYRDAFGRLWSLLWTSILIGIVAGLMAVTFIGIPFAIYFGLGWSLALQTVMMERTSGRAAMRRSSQLVDGHRWRMLAVWVLMGLLVGILQSIPSLVVGAATGLFSQSPAGVPAFVQVANALIGAVAESVFGSLSWIAVTVLYYELRVRKEAFDLERLAGSSEAPLSPSTVNES
jgi:hypothetical protein